MEIIKHLRTFTVVVMLFGLICAGCSHLEQNTSDNTKGINTLEEKINAMTESIDNINTRNNDLANELGNLQEEISETKNMIQGMKQQQALIEANRNKIEALESLEDKHNDLAKGLNEIKEAEQKTSITDIKGAAYTLSEKAIESYSQGRFEDAIAQWKEALKHGPTNLEAKFNIEIAKDRLKVKKIQEGLKALRLQKGKAK